jgi:prepilin-type N-terminal cleavage/methylation domain-containing protein
MPTFPDAVRRPRSAGFTLVELLMALVVGGILTTILLQLMQGHGRFLASQAAREEVQQNGRASLDLIAADLRALPPSAIRDMQANSVRFYLPRAWGVLCNAVGVGSQTAYVVFPAGSFPGDFASGTRQWGVAVEQTASPAQPTGEYAYRTQAARVSAGTQCNGVQPNSGNGALYLTAGFTVGASLVDAGVLGAGGTILPGTPVMVFEEMRYDVAEGSGPPGYWIRRMSGYSGSSRNMQPMAGPLPGPSSLVFTYLRPNGVTAAANAAQVGRVRVWLEVESRSKRVSNGQLRPEQTDTMTTDVVLRNQ